MKLYFNSSFSTGKSSLKLSCASKYNLIPIPEIFRTILAEREITISSARSKVHLIEELQKEVIIRQLEEEKKAYSIKGITACRGLDSFAFAIKFCSPDFVYKSITEDWFLDYVCWLKKDSYHFLIKPEKDLLQNDGVRDLDWNLSLEIYGIVKCLLRINGIKYVLLSDNNMSERESIIDSLIKERTVCCP